MSFNEIYHDRDIIALQNRGHLGQFLAGYFYTENCLSNDVSVLKGLHISRSKMQSAILICRCLKKQSALKNRFSVLARSRDYIQNKNLYRFWVSNAVEN